MAFSAVPGAHANRFKLNAAVTCEIKLFENHFSLHRRWSEIIMPQIVSKLFQRLTKISIMFSVAEIILK